MAVAALEAVEALVSAAEAAVVPNRLDLTRITTPAVKKLQTAPETKGFLWEDTPEVNLPMHPEAVDEDVVPDSSVAALFVEVAEEIDIHPSTSTKKAVGNKRISMSVETTKDVAVVEAAAEVVVASEEVCGVGLAAGVSVEASAEVSVGAVVVTEEVVCVAAAEAVEVVVAEVEVVDRPMAKVAPKKTTAKKIKREQEHIKRTFNACVKERKKKIASKIQIFVFALRSTQNWI